MIDNNLFRPPTTTIVTYQHNTLRMGIFFMGPWPWYNTESLAGPCRSNILAKINMHGIELGVPFQIGLREDQRTLGLFIKNNAELWYQ